MANITETIPFDFSDIYDYIEEKFEDNGYDTQEGSSTMQLVTAMSYLVSMLNANTATNINETLLTLARKRSVMLQDARVLGYEIEHTQSYQYEIKMRFENESSIDVIEKINKYSKFESGDHTYYYVDDTLEINVPAGSIYVDDENDTSVYKTITVKEGVLHLYENEETLSVTLNSEYDSDNDAWNIQSYVDVPFTNVEETGIEMFVKYYDVNGYLQYEEWKRSSQFMIDADTELTYEFVRLDHLDYGTPRLYFKIGDVGNTMRSGSIVQMNIITSTGSLGAMTEMPKCESVNCTMIDYTLSIQGADEETDESIRINAPLFNNTANRVVTQSDYTSFCNRQTSVKTSKIWDGYDEYPRQQGKIWFSFLPATINRQLTTTDFYQWNMQDLNDTINWYIENDEIQDVYNVLDEYKVPTMKFHHRHPVFLDFSFAITIARYNIATSVTDIHESIYNIINNFFTDDVDDDANIAEVFNYEYFQSNLIKRIDSILTDNMGFDMVLKNKINLSNFNVNNEKLDSISEFNKKEIRFHLGLPFEDIFDSESNIIFENLPNINTLNIFNNLNLYVDESTMSINVDDKITSYQIKLSDETIIGEYQIFNDTKQQIEIVLYITVNEPDDIITYGASSYNDGIDMSYLTIENVNDSPGIFVDVHYPSSNIAVARNTIPRLKQVLFN